MDAAVDDIAKTDCVDSAAAHSICAGYQCENDGSLGRNVAGKSTCWTVKATPSSRVHPVCDDVEVVSKIGALLNQDVKTSHLFKEQQIKCELSKNQQFVELQQHVPSGSSLRCQVQLQHHLASYQHGSYEDTQGATFNIGYSTTADMPATKLCSNFLQDHTEIRREGHYDILEASRYFNNARPEQLNSVVFYPNVQLQQNQVGVAPSTTRKQDEARTDGSRLSSSTSSPEETSSKFLPDNVLPLCENELEQISVRDLNKLLQGQERSLISKVKAKRRTLKNRGYALKCRSRRVEVQNQLMAENKALKQELNFLKQQLTGWQDGKSELAYLRVEVSRLRSALQLQLHRDQNNNSVKDLLEPAHHYNPGYYSNPSATTVSLSTVSHPVRESGGLVPMNFGTVFSNAVNRCVFPVSSATAAAAVLCGNSQEISKVVAKEEENQKWNSSTNFQLTSCSSSA